MRETGTQRVLRALETLHGEGVLERLPRRLGRRYCAVPDCDEQPVVGSDYCDGHFPKEAA